MNHVKVPWQSWVVVCDGAKALIFRNDGDPELINLTLLESLVHQAPPTRELGTDRPGHVHESHGGGRSSVETTDLHLEVETAFLADLAGRLDTAVRDHTVDKIVLLAPPRALGILRGQLQATTRDAIIAEVAKDLAHLSTAEIEKHLAG
ncbi:MAG: host attachment family protein [Beijerinckiaceae bacterium]|nr:host attachment family protein [Beijerinckiaceae bacterium]